jgi:glycosyltransferase involved in cell wall biosynthesis
VWTPTPNLSWARASDTSSGVAGYKVVLDGRVLPLTTRLSFHPASALADGRHAWRVLAIDRAGNVRPSAPRAFVVRSVRIVRHSRAFRLAHGLALGVFCLSRCSITARVALAGSQVGVSVRRRGRPGIDALIVRLTGGLRRRLSARRARADLLVVVTTRIGRQRRTVRLHCAGEPRGQSTATMRHNISWVAALRILHLIDLAPHKEGPVELQAIETARQASARGMQMTAYFTGSVPEWFSERMRDAGAEAKLLDRSRWREEAIAACEREAPTIAHFHFGPHTGMNEAASRGITVVRTEHSPRPPRSAAAARAVVRHWQTRGVRLFIAVSQYIAHQTVRDFAVRPSRVRVVLNATDTERFRPRPEQKWALRRELLGWGEEHVVITVAANLRPSKRQHLAVLAMHELLRAAPDARLLLAGEGPDRASVQQLVRDEGLQNVVRFLYEDNDVAKLYAASDIALLPSVGEGLPGGGIEAIACGLPLVATPNGGTPEVFEDGVSGISVQEQTAHGVAAALAPLALDPALRQRIGAAARARAETLFPIARPAGETVDIYEELLRAPARSLNWRRGA